MKCSELWLREWVNPSISSEALSNQITMAGLEVDCVEAVVSIFNGVVVGHIVECTVHPYSVIMQVTKVNIGFYRLLNILCSATNCRTGIKVAVSPPTIDGVFNVLENTSEGMLCSFSDLGISEQNEKIIEIQEDALIGTDIREYLNINDNTIEMNITPNRADCLGTIGIARDIAVLNQLALNVPPDISPVASTIPSTIPVRVEATRECPRYLSRIVKGINMKAITPLWMCEKLRRCAVHSINPVVDIIQYVLLELGHPIHFFDVHLIEGGIFIRIAKKKETIYIRNGKNIKLSADILVVADHQKALAIGGIVGSKCSAINKETNNVLLECAFFIPLAITGKARRYGLHTDASHRYERGVDSALQYKAIERATRLLINICGGQAAPIVDVTNKAEFPPSATIILRREKIDRMMGHIVLSEPVSEIISSLGFVVTHLLGDHWLLVVPSWRFDIEMEEDLVEEIARIYGYNNIPTVPVNADLIMVPNRTAADFTLKRVKTWFVDHGFQEVITYSFVNPKVQMLLHPTEEALMLPNPISVEMSAMRLSLWTSLLPVVVYNQNRKKSRIRIFESGLRFLHSSSADLGIRQDVMLAGVITGYAHEKHWDLSRKQVDFYDLKGDLESILELTGNFSPLQFKVEMNPALHPGQSAAVYLHDVRIGFLGVLHPEMERKLDIKNRTLMFELEWSKITSNMVSPVQNIPPFPSNRRDIAIIVAENIPAYDILAECKKVDFHQIVDVKLFDVYRGNGIAAGYKSLAIRIVLQSTLRTLEEEDIAVLLLKCINVLQQRFQALLRTSF